MANVTALNNDIDALRGNLDQFFLVIMGCLIFCEYIILDSIVNFFPLFRWYLVCCAKGMWKFWKLESLFAN